MSVIDRKNHISMCQILDRYRDRSIRISKSKSVIFLFVGLDEMSSLPKKA